MPDAPRKPLTLFDSTCIVVGIIVGAGIFQTAPIVAAAAGSGPWMIAAWVGGGTIALFGALCYAELASAFPKSGGDYVYLNRAYGRGTGFMFGWTQMTILMPGNTAMMAFVFASYAITLWPAAWPALPPWAFAAGGVCVLTLINVVGVTSGKWTQNFLTVVKVLGALIVVGAGLLPIERAVVEAPALTARPPTELALIMVMFTFGGWGDLGFVASEVRNPKRNIVRALVLAIATVTGVYVLINLAYLNALGFNGMASSEAIAVDTAATAMPGAAERLVAALICVSALGAMNGIILTGSRVSWAMGADHRVLAVFGRWSAHRGVPTVSLLFLGAVAIGIIVAAGSFVDTLQYTTPVAWTFLSLTAVSVFVLRRREPNVDRPYRVIGHPFTTLIYAAVCLFMLYSGIRYALSQAPERWPVPAGLAIALLIMVAGAVVYVVAARRPASS